MASNSAQGIPDEPPPSYSQAVGSSGNNNNNTSAASSRPQRSSSYRVENDHLAVPGPSTAGESISNAARRSMEDHNRPLPDGWVRCYDDEQHHQFFVDTRANPPRSIWVHPYDDHDYLRMLSSEERERLQQEGLIGEPTTPNKINAIYFDSDTDEDTQSRPIASSSSSGGGSGVPQLPPRPASKEKPSFGRKLKDKLTGMTHEEREAERKRMAELERQAYQQHLRFREAMARAAETGQPQLLGKDRNGKDVYVDPPSYRAGYPGAASMYGPNGYGYNPYVQGRYASPSTAYMRPGYPYARPYGGGGLGRGGYGLPLALGGGLLGGMLLGDMMF